MTIQFATGISKGINSSQTAQDALAQAKSKLNNSQVGLALVFCSSEYDYNEVVATVRSQTANAPLIGCSTAGEFTEEQVVSKGIAVGLFAADDIRFFLSMADGLKEDPFDAVTRAAEKLPKQVEGYPYLSALIFHDGLAGKGEETVLCASSLLGEDVKFVGGSAGDDLKFVSTKIFFNNEVTGNSVAICLMATKKPIITSVRHGHSPISEKLTATKAVDNILFEVNGKPAWEVWKECTRDYAKVLGIDVDTLTDPSAIGSFLLCFELGLDTGDEQYKVRVPLAKNDDGSLSFACTIFEGAVFRIMQSKKDEQINSAKDTALLAKKQIKDSRIAAALVFDCCCRGIILGDDFKKGVEAIKSELGHVPILGFETYGEICMDPGQFSGFHNTTTVIALIRD